MSERFGVLNNLRSGRGGSCVPRILALLRDHPDVVHVETDSPRSADALEELARRGVTRLVVNGGDGTLQVALTEILSNPELDQIREVAPLRGGRTSMTARDLGAASDPVKGLRQLLEAARSGRLAERRVDRPVLRSESSHRSEPQYGFYFGIGAIRRAIALTHRVFPEGRSQGTLGAGMVTAGMLARMAVRSSGGVLEPDKVQLRLADGSPVDGAMILLMASTLRRLFLGLDPFWGPGDGDVRFMAIESGARHLPRAIGLLWGRARPFVTPENGYHSANVAKAELRFDCGFTVDGEIFDPEPDETVRLTADRRIAFLRA